MESGRIILAVFIVVNIISCKTAMKPSFIAFSCGLPQDPNELREAILIDDNSQVFYAIETAPTSGKYIYYTCQADSSFIEYIKKQVPVFFQDSLYEVHVTGASPCEIVIKTNNQILRKEFFQSSLNETQLLLYKMFLNFKPDDSCLQDKSFKFKTSLMIEKLPKPPKKPVMGSVPR